MGIDVSALRLLTRWGDRPGRRGLTGSHSRERLRCWYLGPFLAVAVVRLQTSHWRGWPINYASHKTGAGSIRVKANRLAACPTLLAGSKSVALTSPSGFCQVRLVNYVRGGRGIVRGLHGQSPLELSRDAPEICGDLITNVRNFWALLSVRLLSGRTLKRRESMPEAKKFVFARKMGSHRE